MKKEYGRASRQTILIALKHFKYSIERMRRLPRKSLVSVIFSAARTIKEWLRCNFLEKRLIEIVHRVYMEVGINV